MSDTPKLMVKAEKCEGRCQSVMHTVEPSVAEVVVWLREQGAGEERAWCSVHEAQAWDARDLFCLIHPGDPEERSCQMGRVLVVPFELETVATVWQPKEKQ